MKTKMTEYNDIAIYIDNILISENNTVTIYRYVCSRPVFNQKGYAGEYESFIQYEVYINAEASTYFDFDSNRYIGIYKEISFSINGNNFLGLTLANCYVNSNNRLIFNVRGKFI